MSCFYIFPNTLYIEKVLNSPPKEGGRPAGFRPTLYDMNSLTTFKHLWAVLVINITHEV